jgi:iron complex outermembrane recepter protein
MIHSRPALRFLLCATVAALSFLPAGGALAQSSPTFELQEVVVTAQKRSENIQDIPASISVVGGEELDKLHVTQLTDIGAYVPGLQVTSGGTPGQTTLSLRGIAPIGEGATVGTYIDDTPIGATSIHDRGLQFALDLLPYDVQRIEVLQGPQGTLYGANSLGGLVKYVLTAPDLYAFNIKAGADIFGVSGAGDPGGGGRLMINAPLVAGKLGLIASVASENTPGYIDNARTGEKDQNTVRQQSGRLALLWQPEEAVSLRLGALYQKINADGIATVAIDPDTRRPLTGDLEDNNFIGQPFTSRLQYYTADLNWDLGWAKFVSASSYSDASTNEIVDATQSYGPLFPFFGSPAGISTYYLDLDTKKFTQEFRLSSPKSAKLEWLVGAFYTHEKGGNRQGASAQDFSGVSIAGLDPIFLGQLPTTYQEYAGFGDVTLHLTERFDVSGGLRYARNNQAFEEISSGPLFGSVTADRSGSSSEGVLTYSVSPRFYLTKDIMSYFRVASGYQAGGPNLALPGVPPMVKSDTLTNYEVGLKSQFWEARAVVDIALFDILWNDIQVQASSPAGYSYIANGGTARSKGVEANASLRPISPLVLRATAAYTEATLTADVPSLYGRSGDSLPYIPRWSGSFRADYTWALVTNWTGDVGAGLRLVQHRDTSFPQDPVDFRLGSYGALDLNAAISNDRWTIRLFAKNVTDKRTYISASPVQSAATGDVPQYEAVVLQPRTIGLSFDARY